MKAAGLFLDRAYDSKTNLEDFAHAGVSDQNHLYKNRNDREVTNSLLKERLGLQTKKTKCIIRNKIKARLSILARPIHVFRQLRHEADPRTTIIN